MSDTQSPIGKCSNKRRLSSSQKVFSAFKSPCRPVSQPHLKADLTASSHRDTPRPVLRKRKTPLSGSFVSPLKFKAVKTDHTPDDISKLKAQVKIQEAEIKQLKEEGLKESELRLYIEKLHEYNEIKDVAQMVIGRLAVQLETTTRDVYSKFGLSPED